MDKLKNYLEAATGCPVTLARVKSDYKTSIKCTFDKDVDTDKIIYDLDDYLEDTTEIADVESSREIVINLGYRTLKELEETLGTETPKKGWYYNRH